MHAQLVRHVYGGRYGGASHDIVPSKVAGALLNRVFR
jgi:hypothetical protein